MDLECPYCEKELEINHDDGFGYEEGVKHKMECSHCQMFFVFETSISFYYEPKKADCLNGGKHNWKILATFPKEFSRMECNICEERRDLTDSEKTKYKIGSKESYFNSLNDPF